MCCLNFLLARSGALFSNCEPCSSKIRDRESSDSSVPTIGSSNRKMECSLGMATSSQLPLNLAVRADILFSSFCLVISSNVYLVSLTTIPCSPTLETHLLLTTWTNEPWKSALVSMGPAVAGDMWARGLLSALSSRAAIPRISRTYAHHMSCNGT